MMAHPVQRYNVSHPEKNGHDFEQVVREQRYTTASSLNSIADEIDRQKYGKNVIEENIKYDVELINRRGDNRERSMYEVFTKVCEENGWEVPNNDESVKDNYDDLERFNSAFTGEIESTKRNPNKVIASQFVFSMDADYAAQIGWQPGMPATPEIKEKARDDLEFVVRHFGALDPKTGKRTDANILQAVLHMDEDGPHLQVLYIPVSDRETRKVVDQEPSRDKAGNIKYYLKEDSPDYGPRHKYTTLKAGGRDMTDQIQRNPDGSLKMKMRQVRNTVTKKDGKKTSYVAAKKDADGRGLYTVAHTGKPRIAYHEMWQDVLSERQQYLKQHKLLVPEQYKDKNGNVRMRPYNALQDTYNDEVGKKWHLARGRVGSHGKGNRPSTLPEAEKRRVEEKKLTMAQARSRAAEVGAASAEATAAIRIDRAKEKANKAVAEQGKRIADAKARAQAEEQRLAQAQQDALQRQKKQKEKLQKELDDYREEAARAKETASKTVGQLEQQMEVQLGAKLGREKFDAEQDSREEEIDQAVAKRNEELLNKIKADAEYTVPSAFPGTTIFEKEFLDNAKRPVIGGKDSVLVPVEVIKASQQIHSTVCECANLNDKIKRQLDPDEYKKQYTALKEKADAESAKEWAKANIERKKAENQQMQNRKLERSLKSTDVYKERARADRLQAENQDLRNTIIQTDEALEDGLMEANPQLLDDLSPSEMDRKLYGKRLEEPLADDMRKALINSLSGYGKSREDAVTKVQTELSKEREKIGKLNAWINETAQAINKIDDWAREHVPKARDAVLEAFPEFQKRFSLPETQRQREEREAEELRRKRQRSWGGR